jgi:hypothetical protein
MAGGSPSMPHARPKVKRRRSSQPQSPSMPAARTKSYNPAPRGSNPVSNPVRTTPAQGRKIEKRVTRQNRVATQKAERKYEKGRAEKKARVKVRKVRAKQERQAIKRVEGVRKSLLLNRLQKEGFKSVGGTVNAKREEKVLGANLAAPLDALNKGVKPVKSPALAALEQVSRPAYAIQGASYQFAKGAKEGKTFTESGGAALKGAYEGATLKEKKLAGDNLRDNFGVGKKTAGALGLPIDIVADPTTYLTFGASAVGKVKATKAAAETITRREGERAAGKRAARPVVATAAGAKAERKTAKKALREGSRATPRQGVVKAKSPAEARQIGSQARQEVDAAVAVRRTVRGDERAAARAGKRAAKKAPAGRGIQAGLGRYKTSGASTAKAANLVKRSVPPSGKRAGAVLRTLGSEFSPWIRPAGVSPEAFTAGKAAERQARVTVNRGAYDAMQTGRAFKKAIKKEDHARVVDAIERGTVYDLPEHLRKPAQAVEHVLKQARRREVRAGVKTKQSAQVKYFPHELKEVFEGGSKDAKHMDSVPKRSSGSGKFTKERGEKRTIKNIAADGGDEFSTEIPAVVADRLAESARTVGKAKLGNAAVLGGKPLKPGAKFDRRLEGVFLVRKGESPKLLEGDELAEAKAKAASGANTGSDRYVIANREAVANSRDRATGSSERSMAGKIVDKPTALFKTVATGTPGFYGRNYAGDTFNSFLSQGATGVARNTRHARAGLAQVGRMEKAAAKIGEKGRATDRTIPVKDKYGRKGKKPLSKIVKEAEKHGVIRSGYVGRELEDLLKDQGGRITKVKSGKGGRVQRARINVEDMNRLSTFIGAQRRGMSAREAADEAMKHHFDYGDLSRVERKVMRRVMPFYTWSSRNIPLQTKSIAGKPGKYATVEKVRQEMAGAAGLPDDWEDKKLKEFQQRQAPFPVKIGGKFHWVSPGQLPFTDLNQLAFLKRNPSFGDLTNEQQDKVIQLLNPLIRAPIELKTNFNTFFKGPVESEYAPLVAAPAVVGGLPQDMKDKLGVKKIIDKRSGKKVWGWPGKTAYKAQTLTPGLGNFLQQINNPVASQRGQGKAAKILGFTTGIKVDPEDPAGVAIEKMMDEKLKLEKKRNALGQQGIGSSKRGKRETPEYKKLATRIAILAATLEKVSSARGDKDPIGPSQGKKAGKKTGDPLGLGKAKTDDDPLKLNKKTKDKDPLGLLP